MDIVMIAVGVVMLFVPGWSWVGVIWILFGLFLTIAKAR